MMRLLAEYEAAVRTAERTGLLFQHKIGSPPPTMQDVVERNLEVDMIRERYREIVAPIGGTKSV